MLGATTNLAVKHAVALSADRYRCPLPHRHSRWQNWKVLEKLWWSKDRRKINQENSPRLIGQAVPNDNSCNRQGQGPQACGFQPYFGFTHRGRLIYASRFGRPSPTHRVSPKR